MATIKALREAAGLSVIDLCAAANVAYSTVYSWESGGRAPNVQSLYRLALVFGVALEDIDVEGPEQEQYRAWRNAVRQREDDELIERDPREHRAATSVHD